MLDVDISMDSIMSIIGKPNPGIVSVLLMLDVDIRFFLFMKNLFLAILIGFSPLDAGRRHKG